MYLHQKQIRLPVDSSLFMGPASSFRVLYIGMLVLTLVFVVAGGITRFAGEAIQQQGEADAAAVRRRNVSASEIVALFGEIKDIARKSPKVELENGISKLAVSVDMMTTIPVAKLERTPSMLNEAKERMLVVKSLLQLLNDGVHDDSSVVLEKIDELKRFVNVMKNSL